VAQEPVLRKLNWQATQSRVKSEPSET
jgi:hypothetical protein